MTPFERRQAQCTGKEELSYATALRVASNMRRRGRTRIQPYHCEICSCWHVGSGNAGIPDKRKAA
jgi:hypothetical protein